MNIRTHLKGQPLAAFLAILAGWIGARALAWEPPPASPAIAVGHGSGEGERRLRSRRVRLAPSQQGTLAPGDGSPQLLADAALSGLRGQAQGAMVLVPLAWLSEMLRPAAVKNSIPQQMPSHAAGPAQGYPSEQERGFASEPAFNLIPGAGRDFAADPGMSAGFAPGAGGQAPETLARGSAPEPLSRVRRRWSADGWALMRQQGGSGITPGALPATYGASQAGGVLRYRIAPTSPLQPTAYLRTTSATSGLAETTAALGGSVRPLARFPVQTALELRVTEQAGQRRVQPAAMAITMLPPIPLGPHLNAEAYAQAGYVGGAFSTPFADGQVRVERDVLAVNRIAARAGAGVWGGAQKGAERLDAGPSASIAMPLSKGTYGRLAVDWRFRLAGDAEPGSGPALTLSAGF